MSEICIKPKKPFSFNMQELFQYHELFYFLAWRDIKVKYKQTLIGILWAVLQPLLTMGIFTFLFASSFRKETGTIPYSIFAYTGLIFWNYFSTALTAISNSFYENKIIVTKVYFPRIIIPITQAIVPLVDFCFAGLILFILMILFHMHISLVGIMALPICLLLTFLTTIVIGLTFAIINVKYRDVQYALPFFIQLLLFVTPVIYPTTILQKNLQLLLYINPITAIIEIYRFFLFSYGNINWIGMGISLIALLCYTCISIFLFYNYESDIADIL